VLFLLLAYKHRSGKLYKHYSIMEEENNLRHNHLLTLLAEHFLQQQFFSFSSHYIKLFHLWKSKLTKILPNYDRYNRYYIINVGKIKRSCSLITQCNSPFLNESKRTVPGDSFPFNTIYSAASINS